MSLSYEKARELLNRYGQAHVLDFWEKLDPAQQKALMLQIEGLDLDSVVRMKDMLGSHAATTGVMDVQPATVIPLASAKAFEAVLAGEEALRSGAVGVVLVAGGQGSRLGFEGPKGCYEIGPISNASLFEIHSRKILALEQKYKARIPFYIMTSCANDQSTRDFFAQNKNFGLAAERVLFFIQGMWPALDKDGKILLESPGRIFMNPDGHGGILAALQATGMLADMKKRGLQTLFYFQVDNPLVEIAEPAFIGLHRTRRADISVKVCSKRDPDEGLGVVVVRNGRNAVVEYTELTREQKHERLPDGELKFKFGSVAIHVFSFEFLVKEASARLPLHVAHKKVPYCGPDGQAVKPDKPNAYKFEKFIFDVIPDAAETLNVEFARDAEFSPVKNAEGSDSPATTRRDMMNKFAAWLVAAGVKVPRDKEGLLTYRIEIDPCYALGPDDLKKRIGRDFKVEGDVLLK